MNGRDVTLTLIHTNDIHSHFDAASRIASYVEEVRRSVGEDNVLLLDCGDFLDRVSVETEGSGGAANVALLERFGYDAVLIGNNEGLSYTIEELDSLFADCTVPVVCANMIRENSGEPPSWMLPSWTTVKSGMRIGVIGLTAAFEVYYRLLGWEALEPISVARTYVSRIRPNVDVVIVLSHLGLKYDEQLAAQVEGIDLILGGHTHHLLASPLTIGNTTISAAGKFGQHVGRLELTLAEGGNRVRIAGECLPTDEMRRDAGVDRLIADYRAEANATLSRPVANLTDPLPLQPYEESPLATLLASSVRRVTGAEIGLVNAGQLLAGLPAGEVTELTLHELCPSPINPCAIKLSGRQLIYALEESLLPEYYELEFRGFGFRGKVLGTLCTDGLELLIDETKPAYNRIVEARIGGEPLQADRQYDVGTLDMFTFGVGYVGLKEGADVRYLLPNYIRHTLAAALNDESMIRDCFRPRRSYRQRLL
ncbi:bifunctional metallophosphatase/5'-nucleotidase [Cohnella panacarvi]|uniref:bifunctional metallophosphatase/5'-nucleotidase n=1 Tax=Cohnella panacarvi TaxID=400776 RepID=UPI00047BC9CB|nr:bifunctional UDP-sugar hydrolase/5'-nucleotidase [Cohnella panacarvi]